MDHKTDKHVQLVLDKDLTMTNIVKMTNERVKKLTPADLDVILMGLDDREHRLMIKALNSLAVGGLTEAQMNEQYQRIGHIVEIVGYRIMQRKVWNEIKKGQNNGK